MGPTFVSLCRHFTYVTTHSPTLPSLYLRHSSFSNPSFASPMSQLCSFSNLSVTSLRHNSFSNRSVALHTSQLILQPFFRFSTSQLCSFSNLSVTSLPHSPTDPLLHLHHSSFSNPFFLFFYATSSSVNSPGEPPMIVEVRRLGLEPLCDTHLRFSVILKTLTVTGKEFLAVYNGPRLHVLWFGFWCQLLWHPHDVQFFEQVLRGNFVQQGAENLREMIAGTAGDEFRLALYSVYSRPHFTVGGSWNKSLRLQPLQRFYCENSGSPASACVMWRHYSIAYTESLRAINGLLAVGWLENLLCGRPSYKIFDFFPYFDHNLCTCTDLSLISYVNHLY